MTPRIRLPRTQKQEASDNRNRRKESKRATKLQVRKGESEALKLWILNKLNSDSTTPSAVRVTELLQLLLQIEAKRCELFGQHAVIDRGEWDRLDFRNYPDLDTKNQQYQAFFQTLKQRLSRYKWTPQVWPVHFYSLQLVWAYPLSNEEENWENQSVCWLIHQSTQGNRGSLRSLISRFRQCKECNKWFYAVTEHQHFCGSKCRKHFQFRFRDPEKHKLDMRKYREDKQDELERARKASRWR